VTASDMQVAARPAQPHGCAACRCGLPQPHPCQQDGEAARPRRPGRRRQGRPRRPARRRAGRQPTGQPRRQQAGPLPAVLMRVLSRHAGRRACCCKADRACYRLAATWAVLTARSAGLLDPLRSLASHERRQLGRGLLDPLRSLASHERRQLGCGLLDPRQDALLVRRQQPGAPLGLKLYAPGATGRVAGQK
jgi:hypothetical protein